MDKGCALKISRDNYVRNTNMHSLHVNTGCRGCPYILLIIVSFIKYVPRYTEGQVETCAIVRLAYMDGYSSEEHLWEVGSPWRNDILCGYICGRDEHCLSFTFNPVSKVCKGKKKRLGERGLQRERLKYLIIKSSPGPGITMPP